MNDYENLLFERRGATAIVRLNRPEKRNAVNLTMANDLIACLDRIEADSAIHVTVLTGAGDKAFCAGADLSDDDHPADETPVDWTGRAAARLAAMRGPIIAAVNGYAYGAGAVFAIDCDLRLASENAKFRFVGVNYGLVIAASRLPAIVGAPSAKDLVFTSSVVDAEEALRIGLVSRVLPQAELEIAALETAELVAEQSPAAVAAAKDVIDSMTLRPESVKKEAAYNRRFRS